MADGRWLSQVLMSRSKAPRKALPRLELQENCQLHWLRIQNSELGWGQAMTMLKVLVAFKEAASPEAG